ncbi:FeMo cofactor biosynthesis protein [Candidatus Hydrogenisulfobacillus filiaventi]|uniref:FeMo cofactor biosynthesis protein NifB n=1 Tax=Candidatus Hydrogenisulfobacillus filiaventi TaxID=2707344 RepID=A0A6F8ZE82_9FIRM|nr:FeMo cofactor biosynthesis protein [Candidatus Hydrogenisulfobacillus filiaventi]
MEFKLSNAPAAATTGCGLAAGTSDLPEAVARRIANHPCYSEEAHHFYARMHVAVAPACNIQCHYCNRRYDCVNESRPGVTSEVLKPEEALKKILVVAGEVPELSVVGIAGPGDALANPEKTFRTFELVAEHAPDIRLCLSTNGLALPDYVERLKRLNVDHVTVTVNMVDPEVGQYIYDWVYYNHKRYRGKEAAAILAERQWEGMRALAKADILFKVNSVLIPGVNDDHLAEVAQVVKGLGAFLHNVMPLVPAPGSHYDRIGQRGPTPEEVRAVQDALGESMRMMRHCRQCRADAIGKLGEDRGQEFTKARFLEAEPAYDPAARAAAHARIDARIERMKTARQALEARRTAAPLVAVVTRGEGLLNQALAEATEILVYRITGGRLILASARRIGAYVRGAETVADAGRAGALPALLGDCRAVFAVPGPWDPAWALPDLERVEVEPGTSIEAAVAGWLAAREERTPQEAGR